MVSNNSMLTYMSELILSSLDFTELNLPSPIQSGLDECGFTQCTPIQAQTLPLALNGKDIAGQAQTGTGKSAAFLIATFTRLLRTPPLEQVDKRHPRALILAPTRELALQIHKDAVSIGKDTGLSLNLAYGGVDYEKQRRKIEAGCDILIGTPGRLIDYFKQNVFNLKHLEVVILDEADRMFDLGFISDVRYLFRRMPDAEKRLSMLFSATLSHRVLELAYEHMNNPQSITIESDTVTADRVKQVLYHPAQEEKMPLLVGLLQKMKPTRTMIFVNTKHCAEKVKACLIGNDFPAEVLSGDVRQNKRQRLLKEFAADDGSSVLIATDVAARGLHIDGVTHVFNYDLPQQAEDYVHRIGRTARAGASGDAISFACEEYAFSLMDIEEYIEARIPTVPIEDDLIVALKPSAKIEKQKNASQNRRKKMSSSHHGKPNKHGSERHTKKPSSQPSENAQQQKEASATSSDKPKRHRRRKPRTSNDATQSTANKQTSTKDSKE